MTEIKQALTIAGSDSGGGAGIQADLKTFQERGVFGTSVITAVTAQNTLGVQGVHPVPLDFVQQQLDSIFDDFSIRVIKIGMLINEDYIELIAKKLRKHKVTPLIIDPVMIAKGGHELMQYSAIKQMKEDLAPLATVITPNIPEAEALTGVTIKTNEDMIEAAKSIQNLGVKNVVVKGGHQENEEFSSDLLLNEKSEMIWFEKPRIDTKNTHGTGCTYAAAIAAEIAKGHTTEEAVHIGKEFIHSAIKHSLNIGSGHGPTNHFAYRNEEENV